MIWWYGLNPEWHDCLFLFPGLQFKIIGAPLCGSERAGTRFSKYVYMYWRARRDLMVWQRAQCSVLKFWDFGVLKIEVYTDWESSPGFFRSSRTIPFSATKKTTRVLSFRILFRWCPLGLLVRFPIDRMHNSYLLKCKFCRKLICSLRFGIMVLS